MAIKKYFNRLTKHQWVLDYDYIDEIGEGYNNNSPFDYKLSSVENIRKSKPSEQKNQLVKTDDNLIYEKPLTVNLSDDLVTEKSSDSFSCGPDLSLPNNNNYLS